MASWQNEHLFLSTKLEYLMKSKCLSDVIFVVGKPPEQVQFPSHKLLLSIYSDVLQAMFCNYSETNNAAVQIINVEDTEVNIFEQLLIFIYTEKIDVDYLPDVFKVYYLAEKYNIYPLMFHCMTIMEAELAADNVCIAYHISLLNKDKDLAKNCAEIIKNETVAVLNSNAFLKSSVEVVEKIVSFDFLKIPNELFLFEAILKWVKEFAKRKCKTPIPSVSRKILRCILPHIRFLTMTRDELFSSPASSEILLKEEIAAIAMHISHPKLFPALPKWCNWKYKNRIEEDKIVEKSFKFCNSYKLDNKLSNGDAKIIMKCFIKPYVTDIKLNVLTLCCEKLTNAPDIYIGEQTETPRLAEFKEAKNDKSDSKYTIEFIKPITMKKNLNYYVKVLSKESVIVCEESICCDKLYNAFYLGVIYVQNSNCHLCSISFSVVKENNFKDLQNNKEKPIMNENIIVKNAIDTGVLLNNHKSSSKAEKPLLNNNNFSTISIPDITKLRKPQILQLDDQALKLDSTTQEERNAHLVEAMKKLSMVIPSQIPVSLTDTPKGLFNENQH
ncbi:BTB/POZ domain-containing protein 6-like [Centruroides sculpturatus]|uniref:BTB/POZ domain-containing protein 6-like n=1 Tax=Centruroides sculpturatus TaxID=218467 RepID=UPI000C6CB6B7|nr:BTB/POZ domain-containing protein 6-like [Centruroides sculpturatus]